MVEKNLKDKVIVVSGGTKGVGRAASEEFAKQGAKVVIGGRDADAGNMAVRMMKTYGSEGIFVYTDLMKTEDCKRLFDMAIKKFKKIDGFFNYAGITPVSSLDTCDENTFDQIMTVNFKACFFLLPASCNSYEGEWWWKYRSYRLSTCVGWSKR